jgi:predicted site-specific integrase-resolvase
MMSGSNDSLTTQQFAMKAGVSASTVSKWIRTEKIKGEKRDGKWLIPAAEISKISTTSPPKTTPGKTAATLQENKPSQASSPTPKAGTKSYSIKEFSELTYLTEFGVEKWLREGRLIPATDGSGQPRVDASNLDRPTVKRLVR